MDRERERHTHTQIERERERSWERVEGGGMVREKKSERGLKIYLYIHMYIFFIAWLKH